MGDYYDDNVIAALNAISQRAAALGVNLGDELDAIRLILASGNLGIAANAYDVDAVAKDGGAFAQNTSTTTGLTFGHRGGRVRFGQSIVTVGAGTVALSASSTNYVEVDAAGTVSANTSGFTTGRIPLYTIATDGSGISVITNVKTLLVGFGTGSAGLIVGDALSAASRTKSEHIPLGTKSATWEVSVPMPPFAATLARAHLVVKTTVAANDTDYWTFGLVNKGAGGAGSTAMIDAAAAANSTKVTGGSAITAYTQRALTLHGTPANLDVGSGLETLLFTGTKVASAANLVDASLRLDFNYLG